MVSYADKPWIKSYDAHVPGTLRPYPEKPLHELLRDTARKFPHNVALVSSNRLPLVGRKALEMTYKELDDLSDAMAAAFKALGLQKGDRVAIIMPNCVQFVITFIGALKAGGVVAASNPTYPSEKLKHQINDSGAKFAVTLSLFYNAITSIQSGTKVEHVIVTNVKEYIHPLARILFTLLKEKKEGHAISKRPQDYWFQDLLAQYAGKKPDVEVTKDDLALFQYTGGTTGVAKAAMATHSALVANTMMIKAWLGSEDLEKEIHLGALPLFHVYGLVGIMSFAAISGARILLIANPREITEVLDVIHTMRPTLFLGVPALYNAINNNADVAAGKYKLDSIRACVSGSAPLPPATKAKFEEISGGLLVEAFGMSETPTAATANPLNGENRVGSIGLPLPDTEVKIVNLENPDEEVPIGEVGELAIHGPQIMQGYHGMPTETANSLREDKEGKKWVHTGDIARMDEDGYIYIVDRKKDMALIGGFNVYPRNVEDVLMSHPAILEAGVAAVPHPEKEGQEALKAWVVLKEGESLTKEDLMKFCSDKLARYEVPSRYEFTDALPRTTVGKILRRELARQEMEARQKKQ